MLNLIILVSLVPFASGALNLTGELGQVVAGCQCMGKVSTHGYCGYHIHNAPNETAPSMLSQITALFTGGGGPWCRTKYRCGEDSMKASWMYCNESAIELRRANDGKLYHEKDFQKHFAKDSAEKWKQAAPYVEKRMAANDIAYDVYDFRDFYIDSVGELGWIDKWKSAKPEERKADDGKFYRWEQFVEWYSLQAWQKWEASKPLVKAEL